MDTRSPRYFITSTRPDGTASRARVQRTRGWSLGWAGKLVLGYIFIALTLGGVALLLSVPTRPSSAFAAVAQLALFIPSLLLNYFLRRLILGNRLTLRIEDRTCRTRFSWIRIGWFGLIGSLELAAITALIVWSMRTSG